ncbi:MAG: phage holin family protein [Oscillospiraceae bacterium]|nr:phage holin family protein [Oscillospiraceae bacterium]
MDAIQIKNAVLAALSVAGSVIANALGGWDAVMRVLVFLMAADYITGVLLAAVWKRSPKSDSGALDSKVGFKGLCKKGMILILVWFGVLLDQALGAAYVRNAMVLFFIGNEGISLMENVGMMGVKYPAFITKMLQALRDKGDNGGETE